MLFLQIYFILYVWMLVCMYICVPCVCLVPTEKSIRSLETELQTFVSHARCVSATYMVKCYKYIAVSLTRQEFTFYSIWEWKTRRNLEVGVNWIVFDKNHQRFFSRSLILEVDIPWTTQLLVAFNWIKVFYF